MTSRLPNNRKLKELGMSNVHSCSIEWTEEDKPMLHDGGSLSDLKLTQSDLSYIRNAIAAGIANQIIQKVSKSTEGSVDNGENRRYSPRTDRKECDLP